MIFGYYGSSINDADEHDMLSRLMILVCALMLQACGTFAYTPTEYPLRSGLIPHLDVTGEVSITNAQSSNAPVFVYSYAGSKMSSNLQAITEVMVQQSTRELLKNGHIGNGAPKSVKLKVNSLLSEYVVMYWKSKLQFEATLGNGEIINLTVSHASGSLAQDLNGCIAESVMELFKNEKVRVYLAN